LAIHSDGIARFPLKACGNDRDAQFMTKSIESILEQKIEQDEEDLLDQYPIAQAEIREARVDYAVGNYVTLDDYISYKQI
jgi:hypothetical protein